MISLAVTSNVQWINLGDSVKNFFTLFVDKKTREKQKRWEYLIEVMQSSEKQINFNNMQRSSNKEKENINDYNNYNG